MEQLVIFAQEHNVGHIVGYRDTGVILSMWDETIGNPLTEQGIRLSDYQSNINGNLTKPYLLVGYRYKLDAEETWPSLSFNPNIESDDFEDLRVTTLEEETGPFSPENMIVQSIYYPINGFFVYLIEPAN